MVRTFWHVVSGLIWIGALIGIGWVASIVAKAVVQALEHTSG